MRGVYHFKKSRKHLKKSLKIPSPRIAKKTFKIMENNFFENSLKSLKISNKFFEILKNLHKSNNLWKSSQKIPENGVIPPSATQTHVNVQH
jgi:hypothetical protein